MNQGADEVCKLCPVLPTNDVVQKMCTLGEQESEKVNNWVAQKCSSEWHYDRPVKKVGIQPFQAANIYVLFSQINIDNSVINK